MEQVVFQIVGILSTISIVVLGFMKLFSYLKSMKWRNPIKRYIKKVVLEYLRELSKDENDN